MRQSRILTLLSACTLTAALLPGASYSEVRERIRPGQQIIQEVRCADVINTPNAFKNSRVRFRCMFVESGNLFDPQHTHFKPYTHANLIVWDDRAPIWDPQVRANPLASLYISKDRVDASHIAAFEKYQYLEVVGEVAAVFDGVPYLTIHSIKAINEGGRFSDTAIYHVQMGVQLGVEADRPELKAGSEKVDPIAVRALAEDHFAAALAEDLPLAGKVAVGHLRGQNLLQAGDFAGCVRVMRDVITAGEKDQELDRRPLAAMHFLLAKALVELEGNSAQAVAHARTAVELDPEQGDAYAVLGITLAGTGAFDEARRQCEKAIRLRPANAEVRWYLGRILDQQGAHDEAIEALRKAIDLTPKDGRLHKAIAVAYLHRGQKGTGNAVATDLSAAIQEFNIATRLNPADAEGVFGAGLVLENAAARKLPELALGNNNKVQPTQAAAVERYRAAVVADGNYLPARRALAMYFRNTNKSDEAIAQYQAIVKIDPARPEGWTDLATYLWSLDRKDAAWAAYQDFVKLNPASSVAKLTMANASLEMGRAAEGLPVVQLLVETERENAQAWLVLARLQLAQGLPKDARKSANRALEYAADAAGKAMAQQVVNQAQAVIDGK